MIEMLQKVTKDAHFREPEETLLLYLAVTIEFMVACSCRPRYPGLELESLTYKWVIKPKNSSRGILGDGNKNEP